MKGLMLAVAMLMVSMLSGCGTHVGKMEYTKSFMPDVQPVSTEKTVYVETFKDSRDGGGKGSARIGRLVGGFGETTKAIDVDQPVSQAVSDVVRVFLSDAGVPTKSKPQSGIMPQDGFTISGDISAYHCAFFHAHNANVVIALTMTDNATGRPVWKSTIDNHYSGGNIFGKYTILRGDPSINCLGFDCHARGISAAMNIMLSEGLVDAWERDGLREAIAGEPMLEKDRGKRLSAPAVSLWEASSKDPERNVKPSFQ